VKFRLINILDIRKEIRDDDGKQQISRNMEENRNNSREYFRVLLKLIRNNDEKWNF
jgi:hypothetical protein